MFFVGVDDALDQGMPDDVAPRELDQGDAVDLAEGIHGFDES